MDFVTFLKEQQNHNIYKPQNSVEIMETRVIRPELKRLVGNESELYPISETPTVEINSAEGAIRETNFIKSEYSHKRVNHITYSNPEFNCDCDITDKNI